MNTIDILQKARDLLADPERWTQGVAAEDATGAEVEPCDRRAVCWCASGAIDRIAGGHEVEYDDAISALESAVGLLTEAGPEDEEPSVVSWNDGSDRQHADVLRLFDVAIANARPTGPGAKSGEGG